MKQSEFDDLVRRKFAEFERLNGRVPTIKELSATLGVEERMLERKLKKALATIGTDAQTEGTSAFKSTLRQILSKGLLDCEIPGEEDLQLLLLKARQSTSRMASMHWEVPPLEMELIVEVPRVRSKPRWTFAVRMPSSSSKFNTVNCVEADISELPDHIHPGMLRIGSNKRQSNSEQAEAVEGKIVPFKKRP
jgi:hypothetical protein